MGFVPVLSGSARAFPRSVWVGAAATLGLASSALVGLLVTGHDIPPPAAFLVFAALFVLSTNHDVVFPADFAASADLAVVLASVIAFRDHGAFVGPLLLGLLAGPLDILHWRRRAFLQMAWNSGGRGLTGLTAAMAFAVTTAFAGTSTAASTVAAVAAVGAATLVDTSLSLALIAALGNTWRGAWRAVRDIDVLQLPLMCAGAAAGFLASAVGAWAMVVPMVAVVMFPEIVQARLRVPGAIVRNALLALEVVVVVALVAPFAAVPDPPTIVALLAVAVVAGVELVVDTRAGVPAVLGVVVVAAALTVAGGDGTFTGLLVGAAATAVAGCCTRGAGRARPAGAVAVAAGIGAAAGAVADAAPAVDGGALVRGVVAVALFGALATAVARRGQRAAEARRLVWAAPVVAAAVGTAVLVGTADRAARNVTFVVLGVTAVAFAWCGATPWRSRVLSRGLAAVPGRGRSAFLVLAAAATTGAAGLAVACAGEARIAAAVATVGAGELAVAMALAATRQWRFSPRARGRDAAVLGAAAALVPVAAIAAVHGAGWSFPALAVAMTATVLVGRDAVGRSDDAGALTTSGRTR